MMVVYGLINIGGGLMAYSMVGSQMSLIIGGIAGLLCIASAFIARNNPATGYRLAGMLSLTLAIFWAYRITQVDKKMMPMMNLALAVIVFAVLGYSHMSAIKSRNHEGR